MIEPTAAWPSPHKPHTPASASWDEPGLNGLRRQWPPWGEALLAAGLAALVVLAVSTLRPQHNWDELAYAFLARFSHCGATEHRLWMEDLQRSLPAPLLAGQLEDAYGQAVAHNPAYFCSLLPFYTVKKIDILLLRELNQLLAQPLLAVRWLSILPAAVLAGLVSFSCWIRIRGRPFGRGLAWLATVSIGCNLGTLSTPDALAALLFIAAVLALTAPINGPPWTLLWRGLGVALLALALATRSTLTIPLLVLIGWCCRASWPGWRRRWWRQPDCWRVLALVAGALAGWALDHSIRGLMAGLPERYSHLTLLEFTLGGPPTETWLAEGAVRNIPLAPLLRDGGSALGQLAGLLLEAYAELLWLAPALIAQVLFGALLIAMPWRSAGGRLRAGAGLAWSQVWLVLSIMGGYGLQLLLFPSEDADGRFLAPFALLVLLIAAGWPLVDGATANADLARPPIQRSQGSRPTATD